MAKRGDDTQGEEKVKPSQKRLKSAAGKSELSASDSSGAAAIYNWVTQGVWEEESAALAPGMDLCLSGGLGCSRDSDSPRGRDSSQSRIQQLQTARPFPLNTLPSP